MSKNGWPETLEATCEEARYYARNWAPKANLDPEECEQEAMIAAWKWWESDHARADLWHMVKCDLIDFARKEARLQGRDDA